MSGSYKNDPPTNIVLSGNSVKRNEASGILIGTLDVTDPDKGDSHTFYMATGKGDSDNSYFAINGTQLLTSQPITNNTKLTYQIRIGVVDSYDAKNERQFLLYQVDDALILVYEN